MKHAFLCDPLSYGRHTSGALPEASKKNCLFLSINFGGSPLSACLALLLHLWIFLRLSFSLFLRISIQYTWFLIWTLSPFHCSLVVPRTRGRGQIFPYQSSMKSSPIFTLLTKISKSYLAKTLKGRQTDEQIGLVKESDPTIVCRDCGWSPEEFWVKTPDNLKASIVKVWSNFCIRLPI